MDPRRTRARGIGGVYTIVAGPEGVVSVTFPGRAVPAEYAGLPTAASRGFVREIERAFADWIEGGNAPVLLRVDPAIGTVFQRRVWAELRRIPRGSVRTYGEVARRVGRPGGARAVGAACGANPCPVVTPCHRVVASAGLGGFGPGAPWKVRLLRAEQAPLTGAA